MHFSIKRADFVANRRDQKYYQSRLKRKLFLRIERFQKVNNIFWFYIDYGNGRLVIKYNNKCCERECLICRFHILIKKRAKVFIGMICFKSLCIFYILCDSKLSARE